MPRTGLLIGLAAVLIAAAVGVLVWTNFLQSPRSQTIVPSALSSSSEEKELVAMMNDVAKSGGYAASVQPDDPHKWNVDDGHTIERFRYSDSGIAFARVASNVAVNKDVIHVGLSVWWPPEVTNKFNGKKVEIGVIARAAATKPSQSMLAVFATHQAGNSGWQAIPLGPKFELHTFTYDVPAVEGGYTQEPMVVLHADPTGQGKAVELLGVVIRAAPQ